MIEISVSHLYKSFGDNVVLRDLSMEVFSGEKAALVGGNGAGKTTLLRILSGTEPYDAGGISIAAGRRVGMLSQLPTFPDGYTAGDVMRDAFAPILDMKNELHELERAMRGDCGPALLSRYGQLSHTFEALGGFDMETPLRRVRAGLRIDDALYARPFRLLSGGEMTRISLARLILTDADLLLLDEPTNHLDMKSVEWLEDYVSRYKGAVVIVSHDRYFLDNAVTRVIELSRGKAESFSGNYSFYAEARAARRTFQKAAFDREQREKKRLTDTARRMHDYAGKSAKLHKRAFAIEKRIARVGQTARPEAEKSLRARFQSDSFRAADVLLMHELSCGFAAPLFGGVSLAIRGGERIGILGDNGTGKTTLMRVIAGDLKPLSGQIRRGPSVRSAYLPQHVTFAHPERTLLDTLLYEQNETAQNARDRLGLFHFSGEDVFLRAGNLSGGEKSRLMLCMLMKRKVNLLLLDEPTNHLDIASREWMEEAIEGYRETLLFISHDRYLVARFATRLWILENGGITDFPGTFAEYRAHLAAPNAETPPRAAQVAQAAQAAPPKQAHGPSKATHGQPSKATHGQPAKAAHGQPPKQAHGPPPKRGREQRILEARLRALEAEIGLREDRLREIEREMEANAADAPLLQALYDEQKTLETERDSLYEQWAANMPGGRSRQMQP